MSRSAFALLAGVNPSTVTRLLVETLAAAAVGRGIDAEHPDARAYLDKLSADNAEPAATGLDPLYEDAIAHCQETGRWSVYSLRTKFKIGIPRATKIFETMTAAGVTSASPILKGRAATRETKKRAPRPGDEDYELNIPEDIEDLLDWTLHSLYLHFGSDALFVDWLRATKEIESINEKRLKNAVTKGILISRELVKVGVLDPLNSANIKLLTDGSKAMSVRVPAMAAAGVDQVEIQKYIADTITSFIRPGKIKAAKALKNA